MLPSLAVRVLNLPCRKDTEGLNRNTVFSRLGVFPLCLTSKWPAVHFASLYILLYSEKGWRSGAGCLISCDSLAGWLKSPNGFYPSKVLMIREWGKGRGDSPSLLEGRSAVFLFTAQHPAPSLAYSRCPIHVGSMEPRCVLLLSAHCNTCPYWMLCSMSEAARMSIILYPICR